MHLAGRTAAASLSLLVLLVPVLTLDAEAPGRTPVPGRPPAPAAAPVNDPAAPPTPWTVTASAANVRRAHSADAVVVGIAQCGDLVDLVDEWSSPVGVRWREVLVRRTGVTGWVFWSLLARNDLPGTELAGSCW
ncbi:hypothetical protein [Kitasatospora viridis]|uniref:SH3 domain-containing protein n=1 Tax=Kitasatospora viridis TaxID=281105 RepID=A0A561T7D8_9ACTN|nr:hypothetical protein [Kitasatospora viridis]TWF83024.1 hypothetical protein FHX73_14507 [Kitasatospora viridis]